MSVGWFGLAEVLLLDCSLAARLKGKKKEAAGSFWKLSSYSYFVYVKKEAPLYGASRLFYQMLARGVQGSSSNSTLVKVQC